MRYTRVPGTSSTAKWSPGWSGCPASSRQPSPRVAVIGNGSRILGILRQAAGGPNGQIAERGQWSWSRGRRFESNQRQRDRPGFFRTPRDPAAEGRDFDERDDEGHLPVVIVNGDGRQDPLRQPGSDWQSRQLQRSARDRWCEIVGIVRDSKYAALGELPLPVVYMPVAQNHETGMTLYVRASVPPGSTHRQRIRREIQAIEPNLPVPARRRWAATIGTSLYTARMGAWLLAVFSGLALLLAVIGIYWCALVHDLAPDPRDGHPAGPRAEARDVFLLVVRDGMLLVGVGIVVGLGGGLLGARSLASFLYSVPTSDFPTFSTMTAVLAAVALVACVIPARRAMQSAAHCRAEVR